MAATALDHSTLRDQLSAAAARTPGLTHYWATWREGDPQPAFPVLLRGPMEYPGTISGEPCRIHDVAYARCLDSAQRRILDGCCSAFWTYRTFAAASDEPTRRADKFVEAADEFTCRDTIALLAPHIAPLIRSNATRLGIPPGVASRLDDRHCWLLGLHYLVNRKPTLGTTVVIDDVFLATAIALPKFGIGGAQEHVFGLLVDHDKRLVKRKGSDNGLELAAVRWHIFSVALAAAPGQATLDAMQTGYPGSWDARATAVNDLNTYLKRLSLKIENRTLIELPASTP